MVTTPSKPSGRRPCRKHLEITRFVVLLPVGSRGVWGGGCLGGWVVGRAKAAFIQRNRFDKFGGKGNRATSADLERSVPQCAESELLAVLLGGVCAQSANAVIMSAPSSSSAAQVDLVIKSPSSETEAPLRLSVSLDGTIRDIKERLRQQHPDHPPPADQRLIFAGKLLADSSRTADVLRQVSFSPDSAAAATPLPAAQCD